MIFSNIAVLIIFLLPLVGCDKNDSEANSQEVTASMESKELTPAESIAMLQKAAGLGDAKAQFNLGLKYYKGEGVPKDSAIALEWFQKAAVLGFPDAQTQLGDLYGSGYYLPRDAVKSVEWYQKAATQGNVYAQIKLGMAYYKGEGVLKDTVKAEELYEKAGAQGDAKTQFWISTLYSYGFNAPEDAVKSAEWLQKAAVQGDAGSQTNLGLAYNNGKGVPKDATKGVEWYRKAAAQGYADAQFRLAWSYYKGKGVPEDALIAKEWFQKAAMQEDADSQFRLGEMYCNGHGVPKNAAKAVEWWKKAAVHGNQDAKFNLGEMYLKGEGVSKDIVRAYTWFKNAAIGDDTDLNMNARLRADWLEKQLTDAEFTEYQRLASDFVHMTALLESDDTEPLKNKPQKQATGTAFIISSEGHALTNHHVINGCAELKVAGRDGVAKVITSDSVNDLALLLLPDKSIDIAKLNPEPGKVRQGEDVIVFGYPLNSVLSSGGNLTPGILSALTGLGNNTNQIQITAPIQPGSSGSPVMDKKGDVMGVVSMMLDDGKMAKATGQVGQNVNFAVNGQTVRAFLDTNNVPYKTGGGVFSYEKENADIADEARKWTVLVECWK